MASMDSRLKVARRARGWTQQELARRLRVSQTLVALWESGSRRPSGGVLKRLQRWGFEIEATALPFRPDVDARTVDFVLEGADLGYPGFAHYRRGAARWNPAQLLLTALARDTLARRVAEALPWLALRYWDMDWGWVSREAKLQDLQNRLGFTLLLARELAANRGMQEVTGRLLSVEQDFRRSALARVDTYCNEGMTNSEREWLRSRSSREAKAWNVLSDLQPEYLNHAA